MRRTVFLAAISAALAPAPAHAATVPAALQIRTSGVTVTRERAGSYLITADARAYRSLAGKRVTITCARPGRRRHSAFAWRRASTCVCSTRAA
jgi:hypothetical protein